MYYNIFDSHSHYDSEAFDEDRQLILEGLAKKGVSGVMHAATDLISGQMGIQMAQDYPWFYTSIGIHPEELDKAPVDLEEQLTQQLVQTSKIKAIGEIGLDYYHDSSTKEQQIQLFRRQVGFAVEHDLPIIVHDRDAHADTLTILKEFRPRGVVHCYSGSLEMAQEILDLGMYLGFTGVVTFRNAKKPLAVATEIPVQRLLLETDCPYMAPEPLRGKRSDSSMIAYSAQTIAEAKGIPTQQLLDITFSNTCTLFNIPEESFSKITNNF